jgi:hypothetical protein
LKKLSSKSLKILIACEFSGIVREAFAKKGHQVVSCDLLPSYSPCTLNTRHYQGDIFDILNGKIKIYFTNEDKRLFRSFWPDIIIAHPPCTYLAVSGNRWYGRDKPDHYKRINAYRWTDHLWYTMCYVAKKVCLENPVGILSTWCNTWPEPQYIQPYQFGHPETKKTGLWLKNLQPLKPTNIVKPEFIIGRDGKKYSPIHYLTKWGSEKEFGMARQLKRSITYKGIANAMAEQWG